MTITTQVKQCSQCEHFQPPEDPKYHKIPEFGEDSMHDFGHGFIINSRCKAVTESNTDGVDVQMRVLEARGKSGKCGPGGDLYEEKVIVSILDTIVDAIADACKPKI
jgi:hypothetical protein